MATFYRVVKANPPMLSDFTSAQALGRILRDPNSERQRLWSGISVNGTEGQARSRARDYPALGQFIARLDIPEHVRVRVERTLPSSRGHYTVWADPATVLACVISVTPV